MSTDQGIGYGVMRCPVCGATVPLYVEGYLCQHRDASGAVCGGSHWYGVRLGEDDR